MGSVWNQDIKYYTDSQVMIDARDWNADFFKKVGYTVYCTFEVLALIIVVLGECLLYNNIEETLYVVPIKIWKGERK